MSVGLNFRKTGSGPVLVFLHGLYGASDNWVSIAKKLENHFTIFIPDLRNHGQSPHTTTHTYRDMADDLLQFFNDHSIKKATVLGHSMGGKLAMMFAAEYQGMVSGLIVVDIAPKSYNSSYQTSNIGLGHELIIGAMEGIDLVELVSRKEIDQYFSEKIHDNTLRQFLLKNAHRNREGYFEWKINVQVLKYALPAITNDIGQEWFAGRKPIIGYPVTFIRGLNSDYISDLDIPMIKAVYPEARIIGIPGAGHWLHAEQTDKFVEAIMAVV